MCGALQQCLSREKKVRKNFLLLYKIQLPELFVTGTQTVSQIKRQ